MSHIELGIIMPLSILDISVTIYLNAAISRLDFGSRMLVFPWALIENNCASLGRSLPLCGPDFPAENEGAAPSFKLSQSSHATSGCKIRGEDELESLLRERV